MYFKNIFLLNFILITMYFVFDIFFENWILLQDILLLTVVLSTGIVNVVFQRGDNVFAYLNKLIIGCLFFGFSVSLISRIKFYIYDQVFFNGAIPFVFSVNFKNIFISSLYISIISLFAGIIFIVIKGFLKLFKDRRHSLLKDDKNQYEK